MKAYHRFLALIFILFVFTLAVLFVLLPDQSYSVTEKRNLSKFPPLSAETLTDGSFMDAMEDYAADQFPLRNKLMTLRTAVSRFLGTRESHGVYLSADDSLIERFDTPDEANLTETAGSIRDFAARNKDSRMYLMLIPTAVSIEAEKLPDYALNDDQDAYIDRFSDETGSLVKKVDVRPLFRQEKDNVQLYYRTDHHWTTDAAYLAFGLLKSELKPDPSPSFTAYVVANSFFGSLTSESGFRTKTPDSVTVYMPDETPDDFYCTVRFPDEGVLRATCYDSEKLLGDDPYQVFFGGNHSVIEIETSLDSSRSLLIIKDSYANCFIPFLVPSYRKITVVDPRYYYDDIDLLMAGGHFDEVLFLYNAATLSEDTNLKTVLKNQQ